MSVIRVAKRTNPYAQIPNTTLRDNTLSLAATGLLSLMLSYADGWEFNYTHLTKMKTNGRDAFRSAMKELAAAGYVKKAPKQNADGTMAGWEWEVFDEPTDATVWLENRLTGNPSDGGADPKNTNHKKTNESQELLSASPTSEPEPSVSAKGIRDESVEALISSWNESCGSLPKVTATSPARRRNLTRMVKTYGNLAAALDAMKKAASVVAKDDFWNQKRYGLDILLAGDKYVQRAEQWEAESSSNLEVRPKPGDTVVAKVQVGALKTTITALVEDVTDTQAHIKSGPRRYVVPFTAIVEIK